MTIVVLLSQPAVCWTDQPACRIRKIRSRRSEIEFALEGYEYEEPAMQ